MRVHEVRDFSKRGDALVTETDQTENTLVVGEKPLATNPVPSANHASLFTMRSTGPRRALVCPVFMARTKRPSVLA